MLVGHVTKDGSIAGPKTLEHLVDAGAHPRGRALRRAARCARRRTASGRPRRSACSRWASGGCARSPIRRARSSPSTSARRPAASSRRRSRAAGRCSSRSRRSSRRPATGTPPAAGAASIRTGSALLVAVLGRRAGIGLGSHDVYVNLAGGLAVDEPGSTCRSRSPSRRRSATGPVDPGPSRSARSGLLGELRAVGGLERRLREAARLGFERAIVPAGRPLGQRDPRVDGLEIVEVGRCATPSSGARASASARRGDAASGDARLTARAEPIVGRGGHSSRRGSD